MSWEIAVIGGLFSIGFILAYFAIKMEPEHFIAKFIFFITTFFIIIIGSKLIQELAEANTAGADIITLLNSVFWVLTFILPWLLVYLGWYIMYHSTDTIKNWININGRFKK